LTKPGVCAAESIPAAKAPKRPIFPFFFVTYSYYAPQKNEKVVSRWHFFATDISTAQTPGALVGAIAAMYHQVQTTFLFFV
jgi:hypothetical protein